LDARQRLRSRLALLLDASLPQVTHTSERAGAAIFPALSATIYRFVSETKQARRYFVSGNVQRVGYRYFTLRAAERLNLTGYARNLPDGRVEAYAVGTPDQLAKLQSALERGPWGASVGEVKEEHAAIDPDYESGFVIIY
jgi:acylphosphatase